MSWKPWKMDVANELKSEAKPKTIKLHPMSMELVVAIDSKAEGELKKDARFMVSMLGLCKSHSKTALQKMKGVLSPADKTAAGFTEDAQMAGMFLRPIHMEMEKYFDDACEDIQKEVGNLFAKKRKEEEYLKKSSIKVELEVKFEGLEIPQKGGQKKVVAGAVKLAPLDVDLNKDVSLAQLRTLITEAGKAADDFDKALEALVDAKKDEKIAKGDDQKKQIAEVIETATNDVNEEIALHKKIVDAAVAEWKDQSRPLKDADKLIAEWEDDVADNKSKFPPAVKNQVLSELTKVKKWSGPLMKHRTALSTALKDSSINKKFTEARDQVMEGKFSGGDALSKAVDEWNNDLKKNLAVFERELKNSAKILDESVKKITKLISQKS